MLVEDPADTASDPLQPILGDQFLRRIADSNRHAERADRVEHAEEADWQLGLRLGAKQLLDEVGLLIGLVDAVVEESLVDVGVIGQVSDDAGEAAERACREGAAGKPEDIDVVSRPEFLGQNLVAIADVLCEAGADGTAREPIEPLGADTLVIIDELVIVSAQVARQPVDTGLALLVVPRAIAQDDDPLAHVTASHSTGLGVHRLPRMEDALVFRAEQGSAASRRRAPDPRS